jgi:uncharacterized protein (DUF433 family)
MASDNFDWQAHITIDPSIAAGHPVIKGTRVPVHVLVGGLAGGDTIDELCELGD